MVTFEALEFNWYVCFSFRGNRTIFGGDIGNSIFDLENSRSRSWPRSNLMVTFEPYSSIDMFAFHFMAIGPFWLRYSKFYIWPWKFKGKVLAKVKPHGHIWALESNRYVCFSFCGNRTIFGWDIANSIFDLEKSRSRSQRKSGNLQVRANNHANNERNPKSCSKVIAWTRICGRRRRMNRYKNIKSPPVYRGDLKNIKSPPVYRGDLITNENVPCASANPRIKIYVCMYVCMHACICGGVYKNRFISPKIYIYACMHIHIYMD